MLKINIFYVRGNNLRVDLVIVSAPLVAVPDFRVVELTDHGNILLQLRKGTQVCGNEDAALCVELCIERIGEVVALDASCLFAVAERADLVLQTLPFRFRIDGQTAIEALRNFCEQLFDCIRARCFPAFYCEVESYPKVYPQSVYFCAISAGHFLARWRKVGVRFSFSALVVRSG